MPRKTALRPSRIGRESTCTQNIRVFSYVFFRWLPGHHFPPLIYAFGLIYLVSILIPTTSPAEEEKQVNGNAREKKQLARKTASGWLTVEDTSAVGWVKTWGLGLPVSGSRAWNALAVGINVLLVLGTVDVVYRGAVLPPSNDLAFSRVGYVSDTTAKILVREPDLSHLPIYLSYRAAPSTGLDVSWKAAGSIAALSNITGYTSTLTIPRLRASTSYQYAVSTNHTAYFTTAPRPGDTKNKAFTFLTTSCIKPNFPYNPLRHALHIPGLRHLAHVLPSLSAQFMLFLGDFIYIDVPHRHGTTASTYRAEYRRVSSSPDWPAVSSSLPWLHVIDDHEIAND